MSNTINRSNSKRVVYAVVVDGIRVPKLGLYPSPKKAFIAGLKAFLGMKVSTEEVLI
jgi:hypothetical protein